MISIWPFKILKIARRQLYWPREFMQVAEAGTNGQDREQLF
jgi:hypothetical protein